jgi:hypothetical protein
MIPVARKQSDVKVFMRYNVVSSLRALCRQGRHVHPDMTALEIIRSLIITIRPPKQADVQS